MFKPAPPEKRRSWKEKIQKQKESGLSIERWCRENKTVPHLFHYWKKRLVPKEALSRSSFTELVESKESGVGIIVEYQDKRIHLDVHFDTETFRRCLTILKETRC